MKYYRITKTFPRELCDSHWQLSEWNIIQDVWTNMFICSTEKQAIENRSFQQMNKFERDLLRLYIDNWIFNFFTEIK